MFNLQMNEILNSSIFNYDEENDNFLGYMDDSHILVGDNIFIQHNIPLSPVIQPNSYIPSFSHDLPLNEEDSNIDYDKIKPAQNDEDSYYKKLEDKNIPNPKASLTSTRPFSDKKGQIQIKKKKKFKIENDTLPKYWRFDMVKKYWKTKISESSTDKINLLIQESDLPEKLKILIHKPNSLLFTANDKVTDNYHFLSLSVKEIFTIGKETVNLQMQNDKNISRIFEYFNEVGYNNLSESVKKVKEYFEMTYEELIRHFYDSAEFIIFKENCKTKFFDEGTISQEGFSLLEDYGLIKLFKMLKKKRKKN